MKELVDLLVKQLGVDEKQARGGSAVLFKAARDKLGAGEFDRMLGGVPGIGDLLKQTPASGGVGKLFGGLAGALGGGNAAILANVVTSFASLGLGQEDAKRFPPVILGYLRERVGKATVDTLEKTLRA
ncbi:MAG TPA: DUF2780 domain-containing protein [Steroidobacteraceae bacterium]|nr:DUF2780 domain-containing protein [Steroidobacteraceae bacterium]